MKIENAGKRVLSLILSATFLLFPVVFISSQTNYSAQKISVVPNESIVNSQNFLRTELYFGMNKTDGSVVTEEEWNDFLNLEVTPRFPQGFTSLQAKGQYQIQSGVIVKENSRVLIFLYSQSKRKIISRKIEQIRNIYKRRFLQESVMRLDFAQPVRVSF